MTNTNTRIHAFILAAGASSRFGGIKLLAPMPLPGANSENKQMLIEHCVEQIHNASFDAFSVILGANAQSIKAALQVKHQQLDFGFMLAKNWQDGMGVTIASAVTYFTTGNLGGTTGRLGGTTPSHIAITLADQIALKSAHFTRLINASHQCPKSIIAASYSGRLGVPCIFPSTYFSELAKLTGDKGARDLIAKEIDNVIAVELPKAAIDIDTQDDLVRLSQHD